MSSNKSLAEKGNKVCFRKNKMFIIIDDNFRDTSYNWRLLRSSTRLMFPRLLSLLLLDLLPSSRKRTRMMRMSTPVEFRTLS